MSYFDISIKDNFLEKNIFDEVYLKIDRLIYSAKGNYQEGSSHIWYSCPAEDKIKKYITKKCEEKINKKLECVLCSYTMLATVEPLPHHDKGDGQCDYQVIIYIKGNTNLHKGTGFYVYNEKTKSYELNTHIGFFQNRGIIFDSSNWHTPMNWSSDDKSKRFSIIAQFKNYDE